jgi:hypothetical protein
VSGCGEGGELSASAPNEKNGSGGSLAGLVAFGVAMAGLVVWRIRLRRGKAEVR